MNLANGATLPIAASGHQCFPDTGPLAFLDEDGTVKVSLLSVALLNGKPERRRTVRKSRAKVSRYSVLQVPARTHSAPSSCVENVA